LIALFSQSIEEKDEYQTWIPFAWITASVLRWFFWLIVQKGEKCIIGRNWRLGVKDGCAVEGHIQFYGRIGNRMGATMGRQRLGSGGRL